MKCKKEYGSAELFIAGSTCGKEIDGFPSGLVIVDAETHRISRYYEYVGKEGKASRGEKDDGEADRFSNRFDYCACAGCDGGARWVCEYCGEHFCAKCAEKHLKITKEKEE